jgi:MFS family permease
MEYVLRKFHNLGIFGGLYLMSLLFGFHYFGVHYINSSLLENHLSQTEVGFVFAVSSTLSILALASASLFLRVLGNYNTALIATALNFTAMLGLASTQDLGLILVFFALHTIAAPLTLFSFDVFLEASTKDESSTGRIRTLFLSMGLIASLFSPVLSGLIAGPSALYEYVYLISAFFLLPVVVILHEEFRTFADPRYEVLSVSRMFRALWNNKDLFHVTMAQFLMWFFFSWYVVYLPVYLHNVVGFSWPDIGLILFIMLIPYVFIEYPAGRIADMSLGEKELMVAGFVIAGLATAPLFWLESTSVWVWGGILFATRIGTALIESMTETYFFKKIDGSDTSVLSVFRIVRPLAYSVGPLTAGVILAFYDIQYLWAILAGIMLVGIIHPLSIKDTK